jgi:hypothetical protein
MIAFGSSIIDAEAYRRYARPGIQAAAEPGSEVYAFAALGSICRSSNLVLDAAAAREDLEALVLVDQATEIADPDFCRKARALLSDPGVAVAGCVGATGVRSIAWWEGAVSRGPLTHRYHEHGGGEVPAFSWARDVAPPGEVEAVDGALLVLSPWAVRNLRFDESLSLGHGFDVDLCLQARAAGRRVVTADLRAIRHHALELVPDHDLWVEAHIRWADKWDGRMPGGEPPTTDWKQRARRAEAEREAARAIAYSSASELDARLLPLERALAEATQSLSWRVTEPLRRLNELRRRRRAKPD